MGILAACLILIVTVFFVWKIPVWQLRSKRKLLKEEDYLDLENEYRKTVAQIAGGVFVLIGLSFTWYQLVATQDSIAMSRETLITDRYSKAIDQLGDSKSQTRLGGIYALGKIAEQVPEYVSIVDNVLASYIRQSGIDTNMSIRDEIQAAISIIALQNTHIAAGTANTSRVQLTDKTLTNFNFSNGILTGADLSNATFSNSTFVNTNLSRITAIESTFTNCNFTGAVLMKANFYGGHLRKAVFKNAKLMSSDFRLSDLNDTDFTGCDLSEADFSEAGMEGTVLYGANLATAKGLTAGQLKNALINSATRLPATIIK